MMRPVIVVVMLVAMSQSSPANAGTREAFEALVSGEVAAASLGAASASREFTRANRMGEWASLGAVSTVALGDAGTTGIEGILTAALSTSVEGVEAGVSLFPFRFRYLMGGAIPEGGGNNFLDGINLQAASTPNGAMAAVGLAYATTPPRTYSDLSLGACQVDAARIEAAVRPVYYAFAEVCVWVETLGGVTPPSLDANSEVAQHWNNLVAAGESAAELCTGTRSFTDSDDSLNAEDAFDELSNLVGDARNRIGDLPAGTIPALPNDAAETLASYQRPTTDTCHSDRDVTEAIAALDGRQGRTSLAARFRTDFGPRVYGFDPTDGSARNPLGHEATLTVEHSVRRWEFGLSPALVWARPEAAEDLVEELRLGGSISYSVSLDPSATDVNNIQGSRHWTSWPRLSAGFEFSITTPLDPPANQEPMLAEVELTPSMTLSISEKTGFRFGIPVTGTLVTDTGDLEDDDSDDRQRRQWSVPFTVVTIIKL